MKKLSTEWKLIIGLALFKLIIHLLTITNYELQRDAYLYYSLGEHLDWGFVSVPPFIGLMAKLSTLLLGNTTFALRLFPAIIGAISVIVIALMVKELKGGTFAIIIACLAFIASPAFLRSNTLFQPVSFNQFFWLLSGYLILKLMNSENPKYWLYIFIVWGIAFYNKYSIAFFIVAALFAILLSEHRKLFLSKYFFMGGIISVLMILPNIYWQYTHNWPLFYHMAELQKYQFSNVTTIGFLIDQILMNFPAIVIWITALLLLLFFNSGKKYRVFGLIYIFTVAIILILRGKSYYTLGLYPILFAFGGMVVDQYFKNYLKYAVIGFMILLSFIMLPLSLPIYSHDKIAEITKPIAEFTNRWEDGKIHNLPQDYADMTGWKELSEIVIHQYQSLPDSLRQNCQIFAGNYGQAGAINFYGKKHHLPEVICFNDNFILWAPDSIHNSPLIYVNHNPGDIPMLYHSYKLVGQVNNEYFRENGLKIYICTGPREILNSYYTDKVRLQKSKYKRK